MADSSLNLMLVVDDPDARSEMAAQLAAQPGCRVVDARSSDGDPAASVDPDVIIWDLGDDPDAALQRLADAQEWRVPIVAIVQDDRDGVRALDAGASGLLPRGADPERLVLAARTVQGGLLALDPSVAGLPAPAKDAEDDALLETLTRREREVLQLMAEGLGNKLIAERLGITEHTAKFHVHAILGKLSTQSRTEAVVRAARLGLVTI